MDEEIDPLFESHMLNHQGRMKAKNIGAAFDRLLRFLQDEIHNTNNREYSITKTKLEEACFYAKKAMAMNRNNQEET